MAEDEVKKQAEAKSLGALKVIVFNYKDSGKLQPDTKSNNRTIMLQIRESGDCGALSISPLDDK